MSGNWYVGMDCDDILAVCPYKVVENDSQNN
jgi:hypothetical protein